MITIYSGGRSIMVSEGDDPQKVSLVMLNAFDKELGQVAMDLIPVLKACKMILDQLATMKTPAGRDAFNRTA